MKANKELLLALAVGFVIFLGLSLYFVSPVLKGKQLVQHDITQYSGSAHEFDQYKEHGEEILWTNSMFSGMPTYLIAMKFYGNIFAYVQYFMRAMLPHPASMILLLMLNFFVLLIAMRTDPWLAIAGGIAFAFSTYFIVVLAAGHNSKVDAVMWLPGLLAGLYLAYRRHFLFGSAVFGLYLALELKSGHPQRTYYCVFLALFFVIAEGIASIVKNKIQAFIKASAVLGLMTLLAVGSTWSYLKTTSEYSKYSIRGESELTLDAENKTSGLDRNYVTQWSNGIGETWSFLVPNFKGGASADLSKNPSVDAKDRRSVQGTSAYWGDQPVTGGPVYVGAGVFLLFLFGLFFIKDYIKWPLLAATLLLIVFSWGGNIPLFTNLMLDYFPMYNKFRAVVSAVVIPELTIPLLAFIGLSALVAERDAFTQKATIFGFDLPFTNQALFLGVSGATVFILLLMLVVPGLFNHFFSAGEYESLTEQLAAAGFPAPQAEEFLDTLERVRAGVFRADVFRSLFFVVATVVLVWSFGRYRYSKYLLALGIFVLTVADLVTVNRRYLNDDNFVAKKEASIKKTTADNEILKDTDLSYRVANLSLSTFNDATTSYYHKSIGGYHGAKLKKYQELIQYGLSEEITSIFSTLRANPTARALDSVMKGNGALNMINTRYFILSAEGMPYRNPYANGNAWFVNEVFVTDNADDELQKTLDIDTKTQAVTRTEYAEAVKAHTPGTDSASYIRLAKYHPERMEYTAKTSAQRLAVFSEIWYPSWKAYIDGSEVSLAKVDYTLRGVVVPAGEHKVELVFETNIRQLEMISRICSVLLLALGLVFLFGSHIPGIKKFYP